MNVTWINGTILPPSSGEYYIAIEAQQDMMGGEIKKGDVEITSDCFEASRGEFDTLGGENPYWKLICWARMLHPDIPEGMREKVKFYFGERV